MTYSIPNHIFTDDVAGTTGLGMQAEEYLSNYEIPRVTGTEELGELIEIIKNERNQTNGRQNSDQRERN